MDMLSRFTITLFSMCLKNCILIVQTRCAIDETRTIYCVFVQYDLLAVIIDESFRVSCVI